MRKLRGLSVMLCVLLALQLAIPYWAGASAGQTDEPGRVQAELIDQSPESVTWRITLNAAGGEHEEIRAAIRLGAGLTPGTVTESGNAHVSQTAGGYDVTAGPGSGTIRLDLTAAITDPTLLICEIRVTASYPDGDFKASHQADAIKPETPEPEPEAAPEETDEPEELPAEEGSGAQPEEEQSGPEAPPADSPFCRISLQQKSHQRGRRRNRMFRPNSLNPLQILQNSLKRSRKRKQLRNQNPLTLHPRQWSLTTTGHQKRKKRHRQPSRQLMS